MKNKFDEMANEAADNVRKNLSQADLSATLSIYVHEGIPTDGVNKSYSELLFSGNRLTF